MLKSFLWLLLPLSMLGLGVFLQGTIKGRSDLTITKLQHRLHSNKRSEIHTHSTLLDLRWRGYNPADVVDLLSRLESDGRELYKRVLRWDLVFALFYGAALVLALLKLRNLAESHFPPLICWLPILTMLADWAENSLLLAEVDLFEQGSTLGDVAINVASFATQTKFYTLAIELGLLVYFTAWGFGTRHRATL